MSENAPSLVASAIASAIALEPPAKLSNSNTPAGPFQRKQLEENENGFFAKKQVKYFGVISDRADRLMSKASQLLEYAQQVRDAYKAQVDAQQNNNMQFLTVISTIFFPLTLITSWYGMNFHNMPELKHGYPGVIILSVVVMITCIIIFKRKKML